MKTAGDNTKIKTGTKFIRESLATRLYPTLILIMLQTYQLLLHLSQLRS